MTESCITRHGLEEFLEKRPNTPGNTSGIAIEVSQGRGYLNLRGDSANRPFVAAVEESLSQSLPVVANTTSRGDLSIYWLGPDEWLLSGSQKKITNFADGLAAAVTPHAGTVTDLSGAYVEFALSGESVAKLIAKGCTLNLHEMRNRGENSAQCGLAKATILLIMTNSDTRFGIIARRSFAEYVAMWLEHSATEFGVRINGA